MTTLNHETFTNKFLSMSPIR